MKVDNNYSNVTIYSYLKENIMDVKTKNREDGVYSFIDSNFDSLELDNRNDLLDSFSKVIQRDINKLEVEFKKLDKSKELLMRLEKRLLDEELEELKINKADIRYKELFETLFKYKRGRTTLLIEGDGRITTLIMDGGSLDKTIKISKDMNTGGFFKGKVKNKNSMDKYNIGKKVEDPKAEENKFIEVDMDKVEEIREYSFKKIIFEDDVDNNLEKINNKIDFYDEEIILKNLYVEIEEKKELIEDIKYNLKDRLSSIDDGKLEDEKLIEYLEAKKIFEKIRENVSNEMELYLDENYSFDSENVYILLK